jgi:hypothetical protein
MDIIEALKDKQEHKLKSIYNFMEKRYLDGCCWCGYSIIKSSPSCDEHCKSGNPNDPEWKHKVRGILDSLKKSGIVKRAKYGVWQLS